MIGPPNDPLAILRSLMAPEVGRRFAGQDPLMSLLGGQRGAMGQSPLEMGPTAPPVPPSAVDWRHMPGFYESDTDLAPPAPQFEEHPLGVDYSAPPQAMQMQNPMRPGQGGVQMAGGSDLARRLRALIPGQPSHRVPSY